MKGRIDIKCVICGGEASTVFEVPASAQIELRRQKDFLQGLNVSARCHNCGHLYSAHVVQNSTSLLARMHEHLPDGAVNISYVKPGFIAGFGASLEEASGSFRRFVIALDDINDLLQVRLAPIRLEDSYLRMLFVQLISAFEVYLSYTLVNEASERPQVVDRLLTQDRYLSDERVSLREVFTTPHVVQARVHAYLTGLLFHNLPKVSHLYKIAFGFDFPYESQQHKAALLSAIAYRHDCVHRNGRSIEGKFAPITAQFTQEAITNIVKLVNSVEEALIQFREKNPIRAMLHDFDDDIPF